ncbi:MAG: ferredoxin [Bacteroidetes bacterium]|nr:ferredoxin [Bacteroidota bacterium]
MDYEDKLKLYYEEELREETVLSVAKKMMAAARTAPKGRGRDNIEIALVDTETIKEIARKMKDMVEKGVAPQFFERDANNILECEAMVLLGTKIKSLGLSPCGMCGYANCEEKDKHPNNPCVFNTGDLGIAVGSAVSVAMDNRIDNRVMYTVGQAVLKMNLLGDDVKIVYGIPLSVSSKNVFFDRK